MVKYPTILNLPQADINRQLFEMIIALQKEQGTDVSALEEDIEALQTTVGSATSGLVKDVADIEDAIGDEETADTILYRIKALETAS